MRNLKKVLALVLALVMSLSLVTIANAVDFSDSADINYDEAVDVMSTIGVIDGVGNNSFDPNGTLTREQAAKLIAYMLMGDNADKLGVESTSFKDVAATRWSAPAIEYCATLGIIDGAGDGNFYPAGRLTGYAFAKMLLTAIGYDSDIEGFTGNSWTINVATIGMEVGLHDGLDKMFGSAELSRQEAAQMALNAVKTPLVQYPTKGSTISVNGAVVEFGAQKAEYVTTTLAKEQRISDQRLTNASNTTPNYTVEFGEKYFPKLRLVSETDDFERPSHTWVFENKELGTYVDYDILVETYHEAVTNKTLYELLGRSNLEDYDFDYYVDGVLDASVTNDTILSRTTKDMGQTGRGVLTQVFVDHEWSNNTGRIIITSINTWLAKASADYSKTRESVVVNVYTDYTGKPLKTVSTAKTVSLTDVPNVVDVEKDDYVLVNMSGKETNGKRYDVVKISDVEIISDATLTKFSKGSDSDTQSNTNKGIVKSVTSNGTEYKGSAKAYYSDDVLELYNDNRLTGKTYNIYLDVYGNAIGVDLFSGEDNYVFISGFDLNTSAIASTHANANAIFLDGTSANISVNTKDTNKNIDTVTTKSSDAGKAYFAEWTADDAVHNRWYTYTVDKNNVYTLTPATRMITGNGAKTIKCNSVVLDRVNAYNGGSGKADTTPHQASGAVRVYGNDNSVYIVAELDKVSSETTGKVITGVDGLYTGVQSVEIELENRRNTSNSDKLQVGPLSGGGAPHAKDKTALYDNAYTVYDKDYYIIASVVVGEAKGTNTNYAYILTAAKAEETKGDNYYWEFDAVVDGTIQTLTVESKFTNTINDLTPGHVQELRYNGDYVTGIKDIAAAKFYQNDEYATTDINENTHEIYDVGDEYLAKNGYECEVGSHTAGGAYGRLTATDVPDLHMEGRTLKLGKGADYGLTFVSAEAPVVLIQPEDGEIVKREYTSVAEALAALGDADGNESDGKLGFAGRLTAVLNSQGVAKWLVINSDTNVETASGGSAKPDSRTMTLNIKCVGVSADGNGLIELGTETIEVKSSDKNVAAPDMGDDWMAERGRVRVPAFEAGAEKSVTVNYTRVTVPATDPVPETLDDTGLNDALDNIDDLKNDDTKTPGTDYPDDDGKWDSPDHDEVMDAIKGMDDGMYQYTDELKDQTGHTTTSPSAIQIGKDVAADDVIILKYTGINKSGNNYIVVDGDKSVYFEEGPASSDTTGHFFVLQINDAYSDGFANSGTGKMKTQKLDAGVHTWAIYAGDNTLILRGSFEVK